MKTFASLLGTLTLATALFLVLGCGSSKTSAPTAGADATGTAEVHHVAWGSDQPKASAQAKAENKLLLIDLTGTTWCAPCIEMEKIVFNTKVFSDYAKEKLVLLRVDFASPMSELEPHQEWARQYVTGGVALPTVIVLSPSGQRHGQTGFTPEGPEAFIQAIENIAKQKTSVL